MGKVNNMKLLYIIVNAGFADEIVEIAKSEGACGVTILNTRGIGAAQKAILGITIDTEKELILIAVDEQVIDNIIKEINKKYGVKSQDHNIYFVLPIEKMVGTEINIK